MWPIRISPGRPGRAPSPGRLEWRADLPSLLIQAGSAETPPDDSAPLARAAGAADVPVTHEIRPRMIHAWHLFHPEVADGRRALARMGRFVRSALAGA